MWTQQAAIELCRKVEAVCPAFGVHVALTGGLLYKDGPRKDCDLIFYRIRQCEEVDYPGLFESLQLLGFTNPVGFGWIYKSKYNGLPLDLLFPEKAGGEYPKPDNHHEIKC